MPNTDRIAAGRPRCFGVVIEQAVKRAPDSAYFADMLNSFVDTVEGYGCDVLLLAEQLPGRAADCAEHARERDCDGVFVLAATDAVKPLADRLRALGRPVVCTDYRFEGLGCVLSDSAQGVWDLVRYAYTQGHRRVAFIHGDPSQVTRQRVDAYREACKAMQLREYREYRVAAHGHDPEAAAEATRRLLMLPIPPTCILYPDDFSALGGLNMLRRLGLDVPGDISVMGFGGGALGQALTPRLTTLRLEGGLMGSAAARLLLDALKAGPPYDMPGIRVPGKLVPGETVGPFVA